MFLRVIISQPQRENRFVMPFAEKISFKNMYQDKFLQLFHMNVNNMFLFFNAIPKTYSKIALNELCSHNEVNTKYLIQTDLPEIDPKQKAFCSSFMSSKSFINFNRKKKIINRMYNKTA